MGTGGWTVVRITRVNTWKATSTVTVPPEHQSSYPSWALHFTRQPQQGRGPGGHKEKEGHYMHPNPTTFLWAHSEGWKIRVNKWKGPENKCLFQTISQRTPRKDNGDHCTSFLILGKVFIPSCWQRTRFGSVRPPSFSARAGCSRLFCCWVWSSPIIYLTMQFKLSGSQFPYMIFAFQDCQDNW